MKKMSLSGRFSATFLVLLVFMIGVVSAFEFDNVKYYNEETETIVIQNAFGFGETLSTHRLDLNTDECLVDCYAEGVSNLDVDQVLFQDVEFKNRNGETKQINDFKYFILKPDVKDEVRNTYEIVCSYNSTINNESCSPVVNGTETYEVTTYDWFRYYGEELEAGTYEWRIEGRKDAYEDVDWILQSNGLKMEEWAWWNGNWDRKKEVTITENSGGSLTDFQVLLTVSYDSDMKSDFSDLRFLDDTESTELDYWIEDYTASSTADVWVNIPSITASSTETIYMYYGNSGASSSSSGSDTFPAFYEDFDDQDITDWTTDADESFEARNGGYAGCISRSGGTSYNWVKSTGESLSYSYVFEVSFEQPAASSSAIFSMVSSSVEHGVTSIGSNIRWRYQGAWTTGTDTFNNDGTYYDIRMVYDRTNTDILQSIVGGTVDTKSFSTALTPTAVSIQSYANTGCYDDIRIRKYASTEPTESFGSEQVYNPDASPVITTPLPANATNYTTTTTVNFNATVSDDINLENVSIVIDGVVDQTNSAGTNNTLYTFSKSLSAGTHYWHFLAYDNSSQSTTSENRTLYISVVPPEITLYTPVDEYNTTSIYEDGFVAYVTDNGGIKNVSLYVDSVLKDTDTSGVNGTNYTLDYDVLNGSVDWYIKACDNQDLCTDSATRTLNVDTTPFIEMIGQSAINNTKIKSGDMNVRVEFTSAYAENVTIYEARPGQGSGSKTWQKYQFIGNQTDTYYIGMGYYPDAWWTYYAVVTTSTGTTNSTPVYWAYYDTTAPTLNITGQDVGSYIVGGDNVTFNWTVSDNLVGVDSCWYNYNSTNTTLTCNDNTTTFQYEGGQSSFIFYANDTAGNLASTTTTIDYDIAEEAYGYTDSVLEGTTQNYHLNISTTDSITAANLYYDGTAYASSILALGGNSYKITNDILVPGVVSDENKTFYWTLTATAAGNVNTTSFNQTVLAFGIDNCSANSVLLYNFTVYDEKQQTQLNGATDKTDGRVHLQLYETTANALVGEYFEFYNETNPFTVCLENTISATDEYTIDLEVLYTADSYAQEFYYISQDSLTDDDLATNISLYLLDNDTAESFKIVYKDESFLAVEGVLQLLRKYTEEGVFKVVEQPKIDSSGEAIMQVELEDAVYTINIIVDNAIDATFNDVRFYCPNPAIDDCEEVLNKFESYSDVTDFSTINDLSFSVAYNATSRVISTPFSVLSGASRTIGLNVSLYDAFGNVSVCDDALTSSAGTLSCTVPNSFGNATVIAEIYDSGSQIGQSVVRLDGFGQEQFGLSIVVIAVISLLLLIMIGLTPGEPVLYGIFLIVGLIVLTALNLVFSTSWVGAGATFLWFIIAVGIVLFKGGNR